MGIITEDQLHAIMPHLPAEHRAYYLPFLSDALAFYEITTPNRMAAFIAQLAFESGELKYWKELATGAAYEGRHDLGNVEKGDGVRYKGRGPIQITGRANYQKYGELLHLDLINHPELLERAENGFRAAAAYWHLHDLNTLADVGTETAFKHITRAINGGLNGYEQRRMYWARAVAVLSVPVYSLPDPPSSEPESLASIPNPLPVEVTTTPTLDAHTSDSAKSVRAGISAASIVSALTMVGHWVQANGNTIMVASICVTALALVFMFRQIVLAAIREWLKGQNINV